MNRQLIRSALFYLMWYDGLSFFPYGPGYILVHYRDEQVDDEQGEGHVNVSGENFSLSENFHKNSLKGDLYENMDTKDEKCRYT